MHERPTAGWSIAGIGNLMLWLQDHALGIVGACAMLFGMWVQYRTLKLKEQEADEARTQRGRGVREG